MVKQVQQTDEYYEPYEDDDIMALFSAPTYYTTDEQLVIIACLLLLEQRYRVMQSMTPNQILDEVDDIMDSLESDLLATATDSAFSHIQDYLYSLLSYFSIPYQGYVSADTSMIEIMQESITALCNQLKGELKVKSMFFDGNLSKDMFDILPNFKRAIQKLNDAVGNNLIYGKEKSKRNTYEFVYGEDKLYRWLTMNDDRVCAWCLYQQSLPPRLIQEIPLDHPRGRCEIDPIDYEYSNEYKILLARGMNMEAIMLESEY